MEELLDTKNWVSNYADYLYHIALFKTNNQSEAEDLVQNTFLAAFKNKDSFRGNCSEKTWLTNILNNKIVDYYRKKKFEKPFSSYISETDDEFGNHFFDSHNFGRWINKISPNYISNNADHSVISKDFSAAMEKCLEKMPQRLKSIFLAKYFDETETKSICSQYEISDANFWVIIFRAKTIFRTCLEKNEII
jgi:RNA polymerase sigma-70 factor (ECF subfamily)